MNAELLESDWARRLNRVNRDIFPGSRSLLLRLFVGLPAHPCEQVTLKR